LNAPASKDQEKYCVVLSVKVFVESLAGYLVFYGATQQVGEIVGIVIWPLSKRTYFFTECDNIVSYAHLAWEQPACNRQQYRRYCRQVGQPASSGK
jgi:hypothetical protein